MSDPAPCYVAAPFSDASLTIRAWHVSRAVLLARLAMACGYAPVEVHTSIAAGVYGDDSDPEQRARGMAATAAICRGVLATPGAVLWALLRDDGTASTGTAGERDLARATGREWQTATWSAWQMLAERVASHLLPEWDRLAVRPDAVGEWEPHAYEGSEWRAYGEGGCAAYHDSEGWTVYGFEDGDPIASGPETGALGRAAADAALRAAGVMP